MCTHQILTKLNIENGKNEPCLFVHCKHCKRTLWTAVSSHLLSWEHSLSSNNNVSSDYNTQLLITNDFHFHFLYFSISLSHIYSRTPRQKRIHKIYKMRHFPGNSSISIILWTSQFNAFAFQQWRYRIK